MLINPTISGSTGATDNRLLRADGTSGLRLQNTGLTVDDSNDVTTSETALRITVAGSYFEIDSETPAFIFSTGQLQGDGGGLTNVPPNVDNLSVYGAGTAYALTNSAAAIDFGTTDPTKVINSIGRWLIFSQVNLAYNGATVAAETATVKLRRTNNTAADISIPIVIDLPASTLLTHTYGTVVIPPIVYNTSNEDDSISIFANVSAALGAGTIEATAIGTSIVAIKLSPS